MKKKFTLLLFVLVTLTKSWAQLDSGLVAYYTLNGNSLDLRGNAFNGTDVGTTLAEDRFGNANSAYYFDGNSYITVEDDTKLRLSKTDFTISMWIKVVGYTGWTSTLISKRSGSGNAGYLVQIIGEDHPFGFNPGAFSFVASGGDDPYIITDSEVIEGEWSNVVICYDKLTSTGALFIDGVYHGEGALNSPNPNEQITMFFGFDGGNTGSFYFNGMMDDIRIYNRKLCDDEIDDLFREGSASNVFAANLSNISFSPNPASHEIVITGLPQSDTQIKIYNASGSMVRSRANTVKVDISDLPDGLYFIQFSDKNGNTIGAKKMEKISH